jgi:hypothetical protein
VVLGKPCNDAESSWDVITIFLWLSASIILSLWVFVFILLSARGASYV